MLRDVIRQTCQALALVLSVPEIEPLQSRDDNRLPDQPHLEGGRKVWSSKGQRSPPQEGAWIYTSCSSRGGHEIMKHVTYFVFKILRVRLDLPQPGHQN